MFFYFKINHVLFSYFQVIDNISGQLDFGGYWLFNSFGKHVDNYQLVKILTEVARDSHTNLGSTVSIEIHEWWWNWSDELVTVSEEQATHLFSQFSFVFSYSYWFIAFFKSF